MVPHSYFSGYLYRTYTVTKMLAASSVHTKCALVAQPKAVASSNRVVHASQVKVRFGPMHCPDGRHISLIIYFNEFLMTVDVNVRL